MKHGIYRNLNAGGWTRCQVSPRGAKGKKIDGVDCYVMDNVTAKVMTGSLARLRAKGVREVCAWMIGDAVDASNDAGVITELWDNEDRYQRITFHPHTGEETFVWASDRTPCDAWARVWFMADGTAWAIRA